MGFSSGLTTGVWMGRDDARPVRGLQGGTAPARAFAQFMRSATAGRPIEQFDTKVTLPEWQLEPDEEAYFGNPDEAFVDGDGNPIGTDPDVGTMKTPEIEVEPTPEDRPEDLIPGVPEPQ